MDEITFFAKRKIELIEILKNNPGNNNLQEILKEELEWIKKEECRAKMENLKINISVAGHNDAKNPNGFEPRVIKFDELHKEVCSGRCYSFNSFKDNYRKTENSLHTINCIALDIDNEKAELTIESAKEKLNKIRYAIITTRSHRKEKNGIVADRFRIYIPVLDEIRPLYCAYRDIIDRLSDVLRIKQYVDIPASSDMVRFWFASPADAEYHYNAINSVFDWRVYDLPKREEKCVIGAYKRNNGDMAKNELPSDTVFETKDGNKRFSEFETLKIGETTPCRCVHPENHAHGDKSHSAFVGRHQNGTLMINCSRCDYTYFIFYPQDKR